MSSRTTVRSDEELYEQFHKVKLDIEQSWLVFAARNDKSRVNLKFCQVEQWDEQDKRAFEAQGRIPYVFDQIGPKINHLIGTQQSTRLDASVLAMERGDEQYAAQLNKLVKWAEQMNRIEQLESAVFYDAAVIGVGISQVRWAMKDIVNGYPAAEHICPWQMVWDLSSTEVDGSDMRWMARIQAKRQSSWIEDYPEYKELIESVSTTQGNYLGATTFNGVNILDVLTERQMQEAQGSRDYLDYQGRGSYVIGVEYYERLQDFEYVVVDSIQDVMTAFDDHQEAVDYMLGLQKGYALNAELLIDETGEDMVFISTNIKDSFYQTLVFGDQIAHRIQVDIPDFPYQVAYAYFHTGTYWSPVDSLIDPQILYNRMVAERDNQIGRANKDLATVVVAQLDGIGLDQVNASRSKTGATIPVRSHEAIKLHPNLPASPDLAMVLRDTEQFMVNNVGGQNALGLQENAAESGKAVQFRQQAAGTGKLPLFDHLRLWRRKVTEMMVWYMKNYLDESQTIRIIGKDGAAEYVDLDTGIMDTIRELRTDIIISEQTDTETSKQMQFQNVMDMFKVAGDTIPAELKIMLMVEMSDMDPATKEKILGGIKFYQEYTQQQMQMQHDDKLKSQVSDNIQREQIKAEMLGEGGNNGGTENQDGQTPVNGQGA